jgi:hypothetical protein
MIFPVEAAVAAAHALDKAEVRGHAPQFARWRQASSRMWILRRAPTARLQCGFPGPARTVGSTAEARRWKSVLVPRILQVMRHEGQGC